MLVLSWAFGIIILFSSNIFIVYCGRYHYFEKMKVIKADCVWMNLLAWNSIIGPVSCFVGFIEGTVMINRGSWGC